MSRAIPFTKASVRRAIKAARQEGLRVTGIWPDGTVIVEENNPQPDEKVVEQEQGILL